jgi:2-oxoacid:acceptor oxidoreductase gamma subunit (pyruvate/2-ketoisovalerate family)
MERELLLTGIGGQGIQLAAQVLARAAIAEGREVQMFGSYGGMMRGGNTEATVVVADGRIEAPPTVADTWSAIFMHHDFSGPTRAKLRPGSLVLVNTTVFSDAFEGSFDADVYRVVEVPATDVAVDVGNIMTASMVMLGAYVAATDIVALDSVDAAIASSLPAYRAQHVARNVDAVRAGFEVAPRSVAPAWEGVLT